MNTSSLKIGRLVAAGELSPDFAIGELIAAARSMPSQPGRVPWRPLEVERKVRRAFADGVRQPRHVVHLFGRPRQS